MGLYDAVDRGGAGRKKEKTLRKPLLIAAAIIAGAIESAGVNIHQGLAYASEMLR